MRPRDLRVCFAGDSLVAGVGDEAALGWVGRVTAAGIARGLDLTAYNLGVRGDTSQQVASRLSSEVAPRFRAGDEHRIVLSFGVNDTVLEDGRRRAEPAETLEALRAARRTAGTVPVLVVGPPAVHDDEQNERIRDLDALLGAEAVRLGIPYVPVLAGTEREPTWRDPVRTGDGFHPDAAGYALLASLVAAPIIDWLAAPPRASAVAENAERRAPGAPVRGHGPLGMPGRTLRAGAAAGAGGAAPE